jgi:hypothetical protein
MQEMGVHTGIVRGGRCSIPVFNFVVGPDSCAIVDNCLEAKPLEIHLISEYSFTDRIDKDRVTVVELSRRNMDENLS